MKAEDIGLRIKGPVDAEHPIGPLEKTFHVEITGWHNLTVRQIWPDGDAPDNPTVDDVIEVMLDNASDAEQLTSDWNLGFDIEVNGHPVYST